jgi:hypothetical protein
MQGKSSGRPAISFDRRMHYQPAWFAGPVEYREAIAIGEVPATA